MNIPLIFLRLKWTTEIYVRAVILNGVGPWGKYWNLEEWDINSIKQKHEILMFTKKETSFSKNCFRANKKLRTKVMLEATLNTGKEF